ncbi:MAG: excinuclease ABC subunit UvrC [Bdellovibrionales bacterium]
MARRKKKTKDPVTYTGATSTEADTVQGLRETIKKIVAEFPQTPGVYLMKNAKGKIIYVGKAKNLRSRVRSYFHESTDHSTKTRFLVSHITQVEYFLTNTEVEAFLLEASLIKKHRPRYNIRLKDDKAYPYIRCATNDPFPRFYLSRRVSQDGALYFGPYTSGLAVRETIRFLNRTFKIRDCTDSFMKARKRPCMTYQIGRCTAPCVNLISVAEYAVDVKSALQFLRGRDKSVIKDLETRMKEASKSERYEAAAKFRDSLQAVQAIWEKQAVIKADRDVDQDIIGFVGDERGTLIEIISVRAGRLIGRQSHFMSRLNAASPQEDVRDWLTSFMNQYYSDNFIPDEILVPVDLGGDITKLFQAVLKERGKQARLLPPVGQEGRRLIEMAQANAESRFKDHISENEGRENGLKEIQERFQLSQLPRRIECFDISNFQGAQNVASQVVFEDGLPKKDDYRLYKIKTVQGANDFAAMKEVLTRRFKHTEYDDPQLVVVDGGKGQLKMAVTALQELGRSDVPVVGLAKARTEGDFTESEVASSQERFFVPGRQNPVTFQTNSQAFQILVGLRDEAHRFAITFHRKLRGKATLSSELDVIVGLGEKRKKILLKEFPSIEAIRQSQVDVLAKLPTFNRILAERILLHLNSDEAATVTDESAAGEI